MAMTIMAASPQQFGALAPRATFSATRVPRSTAAGPVWLCCPRLCFSSPAPVTAGTAIPALELRAPCPASAPRALAPRSADWEERPAVRRGQAAAGAPTHIPPHGAAGDRCGRRSSHRSLCAAPPSNAPAAQTNLGRGLCSQRRNPTSPRAIRCCCSSPESRAAALAPGAASVPPGAASAAPGAPVAAVCPSWRAAELRVRVADPRDAASLASLDAACSADGSSGWSEGIYQEDLKPGGPNLILLCELLMPPPPPPSAASSASSPLPPSSPPSQSTPPPPPPESDVLQTAAAAAATATEAGQEPRTLVVALAAGCEVAGEVSLTNLAVASEARGAGLGRRMACELLARLGSERYLTFLEVRKDNAAAQALYDRLGFVAVGVRKRYNPDGSDSLVMVRQPAPLR